MTRARTDTIGDLGRIAARTPPKRPAPPPREPPGRERGAVARWIHGALFENLGLKLLSIILAVTVFLLVNTDRDREVTEHVAVSYTLPDDKVLVSDRLDELRLTIRGDRRKLRNFHEDKFEYPVTLDLTHAADGDFRITPDMVQLPAGLAVTSISPSTVRVAFVRRVDRVVEIAAQVTGRPAHGYVVSEVKTTPATVTARGAEPIIKALQSIRTENVPLDDRSDAFEVDVDLVPPTGVKLPDTTHAVVHVAFDEELVTRKVPGLKVVALAEDGSRWTVSPAQVDVTLTGALLAVEKARATLTPVVRMAAKDKAREMAVMLDGLPPGVGAKISPEHVKIAPAR